MDLLDTIDALDTLDLSLLGMCLLLGMWLLDLLDSLDLLDLLASLDSSGYLDLCLEELSSQHFSWRLLLWSHLLLACGCLGCC